MKDYYKILGVRETASAGEIRARWIELIRELHPDGKKEGEAENRRLKQVNEAYGVLKHSSTRVEYDLKRAFYRKNRGSFLRKVMLFPGILIALLILGLIYSKRPEVPLLPDSTSPSVRGSINRDVNPPSPPLSVDNGVPNDITVPNNLRSIKRSPPVPNGKESTTARKPPLSGPKDHKSPATSTDRSISVAHLSSAAGQRKQSAQPKPPRRKEKSETSASVPKAVPRPITGDSDVELSKLNDPDPSALLKNGEAPSAPVESESPVTTQHTDTQKNQGKNPEDRESADPGNTPISVSHLVIAPHSSISVEGQIAQSKPPSLIATEQEVRKFFALYITQYTQKDIDSFHSLFSPRAIQNGKHGGDEIRKIYSAFFDQSQELQYRLDDTRIEIYQNAVHVRAHYNVKQKLKKGMGKKIWKGDIRWILVRENGILKIRYLDYKQRNSP